MPAGRPRARLHHSRRKHGAKQLVVVPRRFGGLTQANRHRVVGERPRLALESDTAPDLRAGPDGTGGIQAQLRHAQALSGRDHRIGNVVEPVPAHARRGNRRAGHPGRLVEPRLTPRRRRALERVALPGGIGRDHLPRAILMQQHQLGEEAVRAMIIEVIYARREHVLTLSQEIQRDLHHVGAPAHAPVVADVAQYLPVVQPQRVQPVERAGEKPRLAHPRIARLKRAGNTAGWLPARQRERGLPDERPSTPARSPRAKSASGRAPGTRSPPRAGRRLDHQPDCPRHHRF